MPLVEKIKPFLWEVRSKIPKNSSVTLLTLENVAVALGKRLKLQFA
jgi:hypothetical protein